MYRSTLLALIPCLEPSFASAEQMLNIRGLINKNCEPILFSFLKAEPVTKPRHLATHPDHKAQ